MLDPAFQTFDVTAIMNRVLVRVDKSGRSPLVPEAARRALTCELLAFSPIPQCKHIGFPGPLVLRTAHRLGTQRLAT